MIASRAVGGSRSCGPDGAGNDRWPLHPAVSAPCRCPTASWCGMYELRGRACMCALDISNLTHVHDQRPRSDPRCGFAVAPHPFLFPPIKHLPSLASFVDHRAVEHPVPDLSMSFVVSAYESRYIIPSSIGLFSSDILSLLRSS